MQLYNNDKKEMVNIEPVRLFCECDCGCTVIKFSSIYDDEDDIKWIPEVEISVYASPGVSFWRNKLKAIWAILRGKEYLFGAISMNRELFIKEMKKFIEQERKNGS
jgi:hypothetical protein